MKAKDGTGEETSSTGVPSSRRYRIVCASKLDVLSGRSNTNYRLCFRAEILPITHSLDSSDYSML
eukprot:276497-Amphidinium_carterae.3